ncbi:hypothetical protein KSU1_C1513 [Candidatus Jettenia caeni]|uniref:DUF2460 domain-containing protein n=1 Tax=Candidatus Jettenia caeni TaxID=247490 RepID=I3IN14_9BACT|nr:DUF2460 domain-containing protein [Candidatus Jettenia sp. AMX1]GAB63109.1 hypothetical protein KSU1_C1513 [Candidatus Jettenia caeni]GJQ44255.1 MAG: hypothetical protein JETCAE04_00090 [Candidatus Jettenia caeni]
MAAFPSIKPNYSVIETYSFNTHIINYGNKVEQRIKMNSAAQTIFRLRWEALSNADKATIQAFFVARGGAFESFAWTNPVDNVAYTVRFKEDAMNAEYFSYQLWNLQEIEFIEVSG